MTDIEQAIEVIRDGGIVIFPTDTVIGIGCRMDSRVSVKKLFKIRKRPNDKAMPVLFDSVSRVRDYVQPIDGMIENLMDKYWPGALTIVLNCKTEKVIPQLRGGMNTLGVRIPDDKITLDLISGANIPIVGSSANFSGEKTPFGLKGLDKSLIKLVDFVLEGKTQGKRASTVIDCSKYPWKIVRQGNVVVPDL